MEVAYRNRGMSHHRYPCPNCAAVLQSDRDVAGLPVRCLGCNAVFKANGKATSNVPPLPAPPAPRPAVEPPPPKVRVSKASSSPTPPEPPRKGRFRGIAVIGVVVGALGVAVGATYVIAHLTGNKAGEDGRVAQLPEKAGLVPPKEVAPKTDPARVPPAPFAPRVIEEEEDATAPKAPEKPKPSEPTLPDPNGPPPRPKDGPKPDPEPLPPPPKAEEPAKPPEPTRPAPKEPLVETAPVADGQIPKALLDVLKAATVFVKVRTDRMGATGSGFVLKVDGDSALIVTNDHVAVPHFKEAPGPVGRLDHELVFYSGKKNEFTRKGELIAADAVRDLAILRVRGVKGVADFPAPLNTEKPPLSETMPVFILGFPFGSDLSTSRGNPALTIGKGTISSLREDENGELVAIQLNGDVNPGNSGGPVVDVRGRLVGIAVASIDATQIGLAIPSAELTKMLAGRVGKVEATVRQYEGAAVVVELRAGLADPFQKLTKVAVHYTRADGLRAKPKPGRDGTWAALPGAVRAVLKIEGAAAVGSVRLTANDVGTVPMLFQAEWTYADGKTMIGEPMIHLWVDPRPGPGRPGPPPSIGGPPPMPPMPPGFGPIPNGPRRPPGK